MQSIRVRKVGKRRTWYWVIGSPPLFSDAGNVTMRDVGASDTGVTSTMGGGKGNVTGIADAGNGKPGSTLNPWKLYA